MFLGQLDDVVRIGPSAKMYIDTGAPNKANLDDLIRLYYNLDVSSLTPTKHCILNPTFGKSSKLVGADGDLIIDETLIDIKTVKDAKLDRPVFNQLICYYLLYKIGGITGHENISINSVAIYFSRHNFVWTIPVADIGTKKDFDGAIKLLKRACK